MRAQAKKRWSIKLRKPTETRSKPLRARIYGDANRLAEAAAVVAKEETMSSYLPARSQHLPLAMDTKGEESELIAAFWGTAAHTFAEATESLKKTERLLAELERATQEISL
jgi:hypothetical protein